MTPEPALWNWRSRGLVSGGTSKNRRKNGSSSSGLRWPGFSLIVPRVAMLTTAGDTRLTMGASEGIGAASGADAGGCGAAGAVGEAANAAGPASPAASAIAAILRRKLMRNPLCRWTSWATKVNATQYGAGRLSGPIHRYSRPEILHVRARAADALRPLPP